MFELLPEELAQTSAKMEVLRQKSTEQKMNEVLTNKAFQSETDS